MNLKKLITKGSEEEILEAIKAEDFNDESKDVLIKFELKTEAPREAVLEALGYEATSDPENDNSIDEDGNEVEVMNMKKEFNMVFHTDGLKHFYQEGKVFDRATKRLLVDTNKKK